ncbi:hypothetical protein M8J77_018106 [Diaphorina citri]|nr:hypothetical protein M8J77_018106 [Diaphorina citri]
MWNSPFEDRRGHILSEWFSTSELTILNRICSESLSTLVTHWKVLAEENLSDHNTIIIEIESASELGGSTQNNSNRTRHWRLREDRIEVFQNRVSERINEADTPTTTVELIQSICNETFPQRSTSSKRKPVYWWNEEIVNLRKQCSVIRRSSVRRNARRARNLEEIEALKREYYTKKNLRVAITQSQSLAWKKLCDELNDNIWGTGYKIVCKTFASPTANNLTTEEKLAVVDKLFPRHQLIEWNTEPVQLDDIPLFSLDELLEVCLETKCGKAPGPVRISPEIIKLFIETKPDVCLKLFNDQLKMGTFPDIWKRARLVLIEKEKKSDDTEKSYRPICLLDILGKVYEKLIKIRLEEEIGKNGGLSPEQFGFISGRSTVDAMLEVKRRAEDAKKRNKLCAFTMVDKETSCGVPQGSVLGALLWNVYYDPLLRITLPPNTSSIAYADDLALKTTGTTKDTLEMEINLALKKVNNWMTSKELQIAPQKTEVVMLVSSRKVPGITVQCVEMQ